MRIDSVDVQKSAQKALAAEAKSAHFYEQGGGARYSDIIKTGPNKGKECAVNLRHARKENLYPSITHIEKSLSSRALTFYRESHLLAAAGRVKQKEGEADVDYFHRVNIEARRDSLDAAKSGTDVHKSIEAIIHGKDWDKSNPMLCVLSRWFEDNISKVVWTEKSLVSHCLRLAGRCDALVVFKKSSKHFSDVGAANVVLDFKTRRFKEDEGKWTSSTYPKDIRQVAFYACCLSEQPVRAANLLINTTPNGYEMPLSLQIYAERDQFDALVSVAHLAAIWRYENNYRPVPMKTPEEEQERMEIVKEKMWDA